MLRIAQYLTIVTLFACPWCFGFITIQENRLSIIDVMGPLCAIVALFLVRRETIRSLHLFVVAYLAVVFLSELRLFSGPDFYLLLSKCSRLVGIMSPALLFSLLPFGQRSWGRVVSAFYWGGLISVLYGIAAFYYQWSFGTAVQQYYYENGLYLRRAGGVFQDSSAFGHLLATWAAVAILFLHQRRSKLQLVTLAGTFLVTAAGLYACLSRAAVANLLVVGFLICVLPKRGESNLAKLQMIGAFCCGLLLLFVISDDTRQRIVGQLQFAGLRMLSTWTAASEGIEALDDSGANRLTTWNRAIEIWEDHPLIGTGYKNLAQEYGITADNTMILALVETGVAGAILFGICVIAIFRRAILMYLRRLPGGREVVIFLGGQAMHSILVDTITFTGSMPLVFLIGMALCRSDWFREHPRKPIGVSEIPQQVGWAAPA
ncbi:MAG: O-antigen ligase family protein [Acidobacteriia bacterium]|nr:O-antigen ligase family protein [Terriglobia bacterium]